ncbi:MAG: hypothetical protein WBS22_15620 [Methylocystis sp.]
MRRETSTYALTTGALMPKAHEPVMPQARAMQKVHESAVGPSQELMQGMAAGV